MPIGKNRDLARGLIKKHEELKPGEKLELTSAEFQMLLEEALSLCQVSKKNDGSLLVDIAFEAILKKFGFAAQDDNDLQLSVTFEFNKAMRSGMGDYICENYSKAESFQTPNLEKPKIISLQIPQEIVEANAELRGIANTVSSEEYSSRKEAARGNIYIPGAEQATAVDAPLPICRLLSDLELLQGQLETKAQTDAHYQKKADAVGDLINHIKENSDTITQAEILERLDNEEDSIHKQLNAKGAGSAKSSRAKAKSMLASIFGTKATTLTEVEDLVKRHAPTEPTILQQSQEQTASFRKQ